MRPHPFLQACLFFTMLPSVPQAITYVVRPDGTGDAATIQDAIQLAANADTVLLTSGVFSGNGNRALVFQGKAIVMRSRFFTRVSRWRFDHE